MFSLTKKGIVFLIHRFSCWPDNKKIPRKDFLSAGKL